MIGWCLALQVAVTERYAAVLAQKREAAAEGGGTNGNDGEEAKETAELEVGK